jgi:hypothetical protein
MKLHPMNDQTRRIKMSDNNYYYPMQPGVPMQPVNQPAQYYYQYDMNVLLDAAKTGAIIGGAGAAALQLHRYHNEGITWQEAAQGTVKGAFQVGVAATAATAVGRLFGNHTALGLVATLATGTAVMYVLNKPKEESGDD